MRLNRARSTPTSAPDGVGADGVADTYRGEGVRVSVGVEHREEVPVVGAGDGLDRGVRAGQELVQDVRVCSWGDPEKFH